MTTTTSILTQYEVIADITGQMLQHAYSGNWDLVIDLGQQYHQAVEALRDLAPLGDQDRLARQSLLIKILDDDARIRNLAAPELIRLGALLGNMKRHQSVLQAYCTPPNSP